MKRQSGKNLVRFEKIRRKSKNQKKSKEIRKHQKIRKNKIIMESHEKSRKIKRNKKIKKYQEKQEKSRKTYCTIIFDLFAPRSVIFGYISRYTLFTKNIAAGKSFVRNSTPNYFPPKCFAISLFSTFISEKHSNGLTRNHWCDAMQCNELLLLLNNNNNAIASRFWWYGADTEKFIRQKTKHHWWYYTIVVKNIVVKK